MLFRSCTLDDAATLLSVDAIYDQLKECAAGFKLVGQGAALHRTADDHTKSIFDKSIQGHTDQYMLRFVKP